MITTNFFNKKFWIAIGTVSVIGAILCYYLFIVVAHKERELVQKGYRVLGQIDKNLNNKMENLDKTARFIFGAWNTIAKDTSSLSKDSIFFKRREWNESTESLKACKIGQPPCKEDSIRESEKYNTYFKGVARQLKKFLPSIYVVDTLWNSFYKPDSNYYYFQFRNGKPLELSLQTDYDSIVNGVFTPGEFFDDLVILKDSRKVKKKFIADKITLKDTVYTQVIYQTFKNKISIRHIDSLLNYSKGIYSGGIIETGVAGSKYKVFVHRLIIKNIGTSNKTEEWTLMGFMKASTYEQKAREVNSVLLFFVLLLFVLIILALPILKLTIMSGVERLQISNVFAIGLSLTVGISVIILIFISSANYFRGYYGEALFKKSSQQEKTAQLADAVHLHFNSEIQSIVEQLYIIRDKNKLLKVGLDSGSRKPFIKIPSETIFFETRQDFNQVIWINKKGKIDLTLAEKPVSHLFDRLSLEERKYFQKIQARDFWKMKGKDFYVESIISWYDGNVLEGVVSIPVKDNCKDSTVLIMAATLHSVTDAVLPPGYAFCIVDKNGDVQFHSDKTKNLRENLLNETERNGNVLICLNQRVIETFMGNYQGKDHYFSIKPIEGTGLFVVAMYDMNYYRAPLGMASKLTVILVLIMFCLLGFHNLLLHATTYKPSKLKIKRFFLNWLSPQTSEIFRLRYSLLVIINITFILIFVLLLPLLPPRTELIFLIVPVYFFYFSFVVIGIWDSKKKQRANIRAIVAHKFTWLTMLIVAMFISFVSALQNCAQSTVAIIMLAILLPILVLVFSYLITTLFKNNSGLRERFSRSSQSMNYYYFFLISWFIVSGVLPVVNFYTLSVNEESLAWLKFNQKETGKRMVASERAGCVDGNEEECSSITKYTSKEKYGSYAFATGEFVRSIPLKTKPKLPSNFDKFFSLIRLEVSGLPEDLQYSSYPSSSDSTWSSSESRTGLFNDELTVTTTYQCASLSTDLTDGFTHLNFNFRSFIVLLLTICFFVWLLYALLRYICKNIYGIEIFSSRKSGAISVISLEEQVRLSPKIFLVGLPHSGKGDCIQKMKETFVQYLEINFILGFETDDVLSELKGVKNVILTHFEYGMNNHDFNQKKLRILERLHSDPQIKIIISSNVQPVAILDFYEIMIDRALSKDKSDDAYSEIKDYRFAFRQWQNILNGFVTIYQSLLVEPVTLSKEECNNELIASTIQEELQHGVFLRTLKPLVSSYYNNLSQAEENKFHKPDDEDIVLRIEILADAYYQAMWNSFTKKEKFLLYDLAKDRFVNTKNIKELKILMEKGVINMTTSIQLMNRSFNNFILSVVREDEESAMEHEMTQKGSWKSAQLVLFLSLLGMAIFFTLAQQNLLQNFNAMLTAVGAVLALVARFGGLFGGGSKQKDT